MAQKRNPRCINNCARDQGITFDSLGHVIVDDHRHVLNVDTTSSNVCGHQDILAAALERCQGVLSLLLALTTVQGAGVVLK